MKKNIIAFLTLLNLIACSGQTLVSNRQLIEKATADLKSKIGAFSSCIVKSDLNTCVTNLVADVNNPYEKYIIAGVLYEIDPKQSFKLHEEAYLTNNLDQNFLLEYALELHRAGQFQEAAKLYTMYSAKIPTDIRVYAWLADCYINLNEVNKCLENWGKANHAQNHTEIDQAIFTVYGNTSQIKTRSDLKLSIDKGNLSNFYPLIFLDKNWEFDWWNKGSQDYFLIEDIELAKNKLGSTNKDYKTLTAYLKIKELEEIEEGDSIKKILTENKIIINDNPLPVSGEISSDLMRICFENGILSESDFYSKRGGELLNLAKKTKDKYLLNIYAYLQVSIDGLVKPEIDKLGWKEFNDERFAISYFLGRKDNLKYNDLDLKEALEHFPNSSDIYWFKAKCAKMENLPVKDHLVELIRREFKTLATDPSRYSYRLKSYMNTLSQEK